MAMATRRAEIAQALTFSVPLTDRLVPKRRASLRREVPRAMAPQYEEVDVKSGPSYVCPTWQQLEEMVAAKGKGEQGSELQLTLDAALSLSPDTAWEVMDDPASVEACAGVKGGDLVMAAKLADEHVRLLVHCLLHGTAIATKELYACFLKLPPMYRREMEIVSVAVGSATLQFIRDEQEIIATVLAESAENADGKRKGLVAAALCDAIDKVSDCMPETAEYE